MGGHIDIKFPFVKIGNAVEDGFSFGSQVVHMYYSFLRAVYSFPRIYSILYLYDETVTKVVRIWYKFFLGEVRRITSNFGFQNSQKSYTFDICLLQLYGIIVSTRKGRYIHMINIRTLRKLENNDGLTLKAGALVTYKTGYQVASEGYETTDIREAMRLIKMLEGNCGVWFSEGVYYIDKSRRIATKREAVARGREWGQISILKWADMSLIYC